MEITTKDPQKTSVALMSVNAKTGDIFQVGGDDRGATFLGGWKSEANGEVVVEMGYTGGDGASGSLRIRQRLQDETRC